MPQACLLDVPGGVDPKARSFLELICGRGGHRFGIPFWLGGEFTTHFRTYLVVGLVDVCWGYRWAFAHGHVGMGRKILPPGAGFSPCVHSPGSFWVRIFDQQPETSSNKT